MNEDIVREAHAKCLEVRTSMLKVAAAPRPLQRPLRWALRGLVRVFAWVERAAAEGP